MGGPQLDCDQQCRVDLAIFSPAHVVWLVGELRGQRLAFWLVNISFSYSNFINFLKENNDLKLLIQLSSNTWEVSKRT
jgi:hypothetical protein